MYQTDQGPCDLQPRTRWMRQRGRIQRGGRRFCKLAYSNDTPGLLVVNAVEKSRLFSRMLTA